MDPVSVLLRVFIEQLILPPYSRTPSSRKIAPARLAEPGAVARFAAA